ncbi:MAG TPA: hypothetical protein VHT91_49120 [Kofleriaceae bacterium]|jgi:hypothetical protein|nr:hypothetical protein [Kofleriaceae bacterium]
MSDRTAVLATLAAGAFGAATRSSISTTVPSRKPAALRMVQRFLLPPDRQAADGCTLAGSPAPRDCATGACD